MDPDPFFPSADPGYGSASKLMDPNPWLKEVILQLKSAKKMKDP